MYTHEKYEKRLIPKGSNNPMKKRTITDKIVIHYIAVANCPVERVAACFINDNSGVHSSCNFLVGLNGEVFEMIDPDYISYGVSNHNNHIINIECCHTSTGEFTTATVNALRQLVIDLRRFYNLTASQVVRHYDLTGKHCPLYYVDNDKWEQLHDYISDNYTVYRTIKNCTYERAKHLSNMYRLNLKNKPKEEWTT